MAAVPAPTGGNDTPTLVAWFAAQPPGTVCDFPTDAHYTLDDSLWLHLLSGLTIHGHNATLEWTTVGYRNRAHVLLSRCADITIDHLNVVGYNPEPGFDGGGANGMEGQHCFSIRSCTNVTLDHCTGTKPYADFVYLAWWDQVYGWTDGVTITYCDFTSNGRQGIAVTNARNILVEYCTFDDMRRTVWDIEPNGPAGGGENITFSHCTVGAHRLTTLASLGYPGIVHNIEVSDCTFDKFISTIASNVARRGPFKFYRNTSTIPVGNDASPGAAIAAYSIDGVYLEDNTFPVESTRLMVGVAFYDCTDIVMARNTWPGAAAASMTDNVIAGLGPRTKWLQMPTDTYTAWHAQYKADHGYPLPGRNAETGEVVATGATTNYTLPVVTAAGNVVVAVSAEISPSGSTETSKP